jgi:hypothetical protein
VWKLTLPALGLLTCALALAQFPDPAGAAKVMTFTGQLSVMRNSTAWALNVGDLVQPEQIIVTGADGYGLFQVADGSQFEVFPRSRVVFRANRGDWKDLLEVWLGKVRVQIEHVGGLPNHNKVRTPTAVISVRGTIFDVEVEDDTETTTVIDEEGQVEVSHLLRPSTRLLNPGDYIRVYKNEPLAKQLIDKGSLMQRAIRAASEGFYQAAINASRSAGTIARGPTSPVTLPGDKNNGNPAPPPPPPPPASTPTSSAPPPPPPPPSD